MSVSKVCFVYDDLRAAGNVSVWKESINVGVISTSFLITVAIPRLQIALVYTDGMVSRTILNSVIRNFLYPSSVRLHGSTSMQRKRSHFPVMSPMCRAATSLWHGSKF